MKKPILNIPSMITQSYFTNAEGEVVTLKEKEYDYFYFLLYLYTETLLEETSNLLVKDGKRYYLNQSVQYDSVEIELNQFQQYGVVDGYKYDGVRELVEKLAELSINVNFLVKDKGRDVDRIKVINSHGWDSTVLTIDFTKEFVKELIGVEKFFMKVDLNNLLKLSGRKSKPLYLVLKDYSKVKNKNLTKNELEILVGRINQDGEVDEIVEQINDVTDVKVSYKVGGVKKKKYIFKINQKANDGSAKGKAKTKKSIDAEVMEGAKKKLQRKKDKGERVYNEEGFLRAVYDNDMEKLKPSEEQIEIDSIIDSLKSEYDLSEYSDEKIPILVFNVAGSNMPFYIDSEYRLVDMNGVERDIDSPKSLHEFIDWANNGKLKFRVWKNDGYSKPFEKSCLLSNDELRRRGLVL